MLEHVELICLRNKPQIHTTIAGGHQRLISTADKNKLRIARVLKKPLAKQMNILAPLFATRIHKVAVRKRQRFRFAVARWQFDANTSDDALDHAAANAAPVVSNRQLFLLDRVEENVL